MTNFTHTSFSADQSSASYFPEHQAAAQKALGPDSQCLSTLAEPNPSGGWQMTTTWTAPAPTRVVLP